jgi:hypothetical protein
MIVAARRARAARLTAEVARFELQALVGDRKMERGLQPAASPVQLAAAARSLAECDRALASRVYERAQRLSTEAFEHLDVVRRALLLEACEAGPERRSSPFLACAELVPLDAKFSRLLLRQPSSPNLLSGGSFEDVELMTHAGWQQFQNPSPDFETAVTTSPVAPRSGKYALRLWAAMRTTSGRAGGDGPLVAVSSPAVEVRRGQIARLTGHVRSPRPLDSASDGLIITDSMFGKPLALRWYETDGWRKFTMDRVADRDGTIAFQCSLGGEGEAILDDMTVELFDVPGSE